MARKMTGWPSKRGPIAKIMPSDGCKEDTVPLAVGRWYDFHKIGWHLGNLGVHDVIEINRVLEGPFGVFRARGGLVFEDRSLGTPFPSNNRVSGRPK